MMIQKHGSQNLPCMMTARRRAARRHRRVRATAAKRELNAAGEGTLHVATVAAAVALIRSRPRRRQLAAAAPLEVLVRGALRAAAPPPTPTLRRVRARDAAALLDGGAGAPRRFDEKYGDAPCVLDAIGEVILWGRVEHGVWVPLDTSVVNQPPRHARRDRRGALAPPRRARVVARNARRRLRRDAGGHS